MSFWTKWQNVDGRVVDAIKRFSGPIPGYMLLFSYRVGTTRYSGKYTVFRSLGAGNSIKVSYDPENPQRVRVVERRKWLKWVLLLAVGALVALWIHHVEIVARQQ